MFIHTVVSGDSLRGIAEIYGTTSRELLRLNELPNEDILVPGLHLLVPGAPTLAEPFVVKTGENLSDVARRTGFSQRDFERWTGLREAAGDKVQAGTLIYGPRKLTEKRTIEVNGYLLPSGTISDANILRDVNSLTYVCVFSYQARPDGSLQPQKDDYVFQGAANTGTAPLVTVTNFDGNNFNTELAHTIMTNSSIRRRLIDNILRVMNEKKFRGLNIDFEHMRPTDRQLYNNFVRELGDTVRKQGYSMSIAMGPKTSDMPAGSWMGAFDYKTLGEEVDFLMLMTYEWGWVGGPPMAVAPIDQVDRVLQYATSVIPANKILMGMSTYGYDWALPFRPGTRASGVSNNSAQDLAIANQVPIRWNAKGASPYYNYTQDGAEHIVWFDDAMSAAAKFHLVYKYGLRGISYWVLGQSFPQNWYLLRDTFDIKKF